MAGPLGGGAKRGGAWPGGGWACPWGLGPQGGRLEACLETWFFRSLLSPDKARAHSRPQFALCEMGPQGKVVLGELPSFPAP